MYSRTICKVVVVMALTIEEKIEIVTLARYHSYRQTAELFNNSNRHRPIPINKQTVARVMGYLRNRGSLERKKRTIPEHRAVRLKNMVLDAIEENPHISTRNAGRRLGLSHTTVWNILKSMKFFPYKMSKHQKLHADDPPKRKQFCQSLIAQFQDDPAFSRTILWTDEKLFYTNGCFNRQNFR